MTSMFMTGYLLGGGQLRTKTTRGRRLEADWGRWFQDSQVEW